VATGRRRRSRNPRGSQGGDVVLKILPWVAIGGLFYLMAQNAGKVKAANAVATAVTPGNTVVVGGGCAALPTDFGTTNTSCCWG
jgi:preprotein translocase subunit YajC